MNNRIPIPPDNMIKAIGIRPPWYYAVWVETGKPCLSNYEVHEWYKKEYPEWYAKCLSDGIIHEEFEPLSFWRKLWKKFI